MIIIIIVSIILTIISFSIIILNKNAAIIIISTSSSWSNHDHRRRCRHRRHLVTKFCHHHQHQYHQLQDKQDHYCLTWWPSSATGWSHCLRSPSPQPDRNGSSANIHTMIMIFMRMILNLVRMWEGTDFFIFHMSRLFYQGETISVNIFCDVYLELLARPMRDAAGCLFHVNRFILPCKVRQSLFKAATFALTCFYFHFRRFQLGF